MKPNQSLVGTIIIIFSLFVFGASFAQSIQNSGFPKVNLACVCYCIADVGCDPCCDEENAKSIKGMQKKGA